MNPIILFFIRAILGVAIAVVITRMFRGEASVIYVTGLAVILVGSPAYAYWRAKQKKAAPMAK